jgi:hypothetical protein
LRRETGAICSDLITAPARIFLRAREKIAEPDMPHRRRFRKGSFGTHLDELVKHFPATDAPVRTPEAPKRSPELQEKINVHTLLFKQAWQVDGQDSST